MSLENEIKNLSETIAKLTETILASQGSSSVATRETKVVAAEETKTAKTTKAKTTKAAKVIETEEVEPEDDGLGDEPELTHDEVKKLAQVKMAAGADRAEIKDFITKQGVSSLADLDDKGLKALYDYLNTL